ncbi:MAG: DEAD/DEAH box helicase [Verrucomicrobiota bacterium JB022]|nr:DEAD/DEAH box helicase [Verrucomicrobiota bacterium JB022]
MTARRAIRRHYTRAALQRWLERLAVPWEQYFERHELQLGREWYRSGVLQSVELEPELAVVSRKHDRTPTYATLEWDAERLRVRASHEDAMQGRALAVAGLYEIEELVGDELTPLPEKLDDAEPEDDEETAPADVNRRSSLQAPEPAGPPPVELDWSLTPKGLRLRAFWREGLDGPRRPINGEAVLDRPAREALIRLTAKVHQSSLQPRKHGEFVLEDSDRLVDFVRVELPRWQEAFPSQVSPEVERLARGVQVVRGWLEAHIEQGEVRLGWQLRVQGKVLPEDVLRRLLARPNQVLVHAEWGLLAWPSSWQGWLTGGVAAEALKGNRPCPRYLLRALLDQSPFRVELGGELHEWEALVRGGPQELEGLPPELRDYQKQGVEWLHHVLQVGGHPLLADEMGLGKTLQTLCLLQRIWAQQPSPLLVVAPASVVPVWQREAQRWFPELPVRIVDRQLREAFAEEPALYLSSYAQVRRRKAWFTQGRWQTVVLDEAHTIKNPGAKVTQACWDLKADQRLALTGTPVENRPLDLWSIMRYLMPGLLGSAQRWEEGAATAGDTTAVAELRQRCEPFMLRRTKDRVAQELPPKTEMVEWCPLTPSQRHLYQQLTEGNTVNAEGGWSQGRMQVLSLLTRLRQVCCDPSLLPGEKHAWAHSAKIVRLLELLEPVVASGHKVVIFSQFTQLLDRVGKALGAELPNLRQFELTGQTRKRGQLVEDFQEHAGAAAFLVSLKAGGVGITLHAADYVFLLDPWWNPAVEAQAIDRVHRIGQERPVMVYRLVTRGTVEERVEELKQQKSALLAEIVDDVSGPAALEREFDSLLELIRYRVTAD